ncbi:Small ribosomal subunit protein eS21y [Salvia divinorum]|uniref:Small ribosomal subunit protein eS21y n=1 Tax=Salvia divinorum TaxID=28513 RepID=A0ABD1H3M6_SALDI
MKVSQIRNKRRIFCRHRSTAPAHLHLQVLGDFIVFLECLKNLANMQNEEGQNMDLYIPRKCSATNRLITSKDHASVQINVGHLDESGRYTGQFSTFALCGFIRAQGDADSALDRLWQKKKGEAQQ